MQERDLADQSK